MVTAVKFDRKDRKICLSSVLTATGIRQQNNLAAFAGATSKSAAKKV